MVISVTVIYFGRGYIWDINTREIKKMLDTIAHNVYSVKASSTDLVPPHKVRDAAKRDAIILSMEENGWQGAPLVQHGGQLLTGSHRFEAARSVDDYTFEMKIIDLTDAFDLDYDDLEYAQGCGIEELTMLARRSNPELAIALGLDADG
jgi:hypothetical protein